ncbi:MAG: hypothetical protein JWQ14_1195, partial [Adhaeribacter sp.]|nr:hypothetical protein [Adhaeribacter sp.]
WGPDASTISNADGNKLMLHDMWGELSFADVADSTAPVKGLDYLALKIGRQEIIYDDQRLLGNLDWLQQARRHDAAILKIAHKGFQINLGAAFNQNAELKQQTIYVPGNVAAGTPANQITASGTTNPAGTNGIGQLYKSFQYLYIAKKIGATKVSGLFFKDDFQKSVVNGTRTFVPGINSRLTSGFNVASVLGKTPGHSLAVNVSAYYQGNRDKEGAPLDAYFTSIYTSYQAGKLAIGPGFDFYSGNNGTGSSRVNRRFDPLYGTPHKFNGLMDYFYAADGHGPAGLKDMYLKSRYTQGVFTTSLDVHQFFSGNKVAYKSETPVVTTSYESDLGMEVDLVSTYTLGKYIAFEAGYAHFFGTRTLDRIKTNGFPTASTYVPKQLNANWVYLMINLKPDFLSSKPVATL